MDCVKQYSSLTSPERRMVYWYIGDKCNYRCSYCHDSFYGGQYGWHSSDVVKNTVAKLVTAGVRSIYFSGGEPAFHPELRTILSEIPDFVNITVITNGYRGADYWRDIFSTRKKLRLNLSFHHEQADVENFKQLIDLAASTGKYITIEVMIPRGDMWQPVFDSYQILFDHCEKQNRPNISVSLKLLFPNSVDQIVGRVKGIDIIPEGYTKEQQALVASSVKQTQTGSIVRVYRDGTQQKNNRPQYLIQSKQNVYTGWRCYAPSQIYVINANGDIWTGLCAQHQKIGNIFLSFELPVHGSNYICEQPMCTGFIDLFATKEQMIS